MHICLCFALTLFSLALSTLSKPIEIRETNAQRFARGLPPLKPRKLWKTSGTVFTPARRSPQPEPPKPTYEGRLEVRYLAGNTAGYVRNDDRGYINGVNYGFDPDYDLRVSFSTDPDSHETFDLVVTNPKFPGPLHHVGFRVNDPNTVLLPGEGSVAGFGIIAPSPRGTPPQPIPNTNPQSYGESNLWMFDEDTGELTTYYTNPTPPGSTIKVPLAFRIRENDLFFTPNATKWTEQHSGYFAGEVKLFLAD